MKVYTKSGDKGTTSLIGGERVAKDDIRVEAYGTVDELTAFVALLGDKIKARGVGDSYFGELCIINSMLMNVEAHLASGAEPGYQLPEVGEKSIKMLELSIDRMQAKVSQITKFTIPGGDELISLCHVCRTICRRAERRAITASNVHNVNELTIKYLNRLSDYLYLLGRTMAMELNVDEILWRAE